MHRGGEEDFEKERSQTMRIRMKRRILRRHEESEDNEQAEAEETE